MTALISRRGSTVKANDLFAGFGGSSSGIKAAGAEVRLAANHNPFALEVHAANNPETDHVVADLVDRDAAAYVDPADLPRCHFLWASPSCKHHSRANAEKLYAQGPGLDEDDFDHVRFAKSEASRVTMLCPLRYAARHRPEIVVVENVVEVTYWGPARQGTNTGDGSTFQWWLREWHKLGYEHECLFLNAMFFPPCPQSRDRIYIVLWKRGNTRPDLDYRPTGYCTSDACGGQIVGTIQTWKRQTAAWPMGPRWGKYGLKGGQYFYRCERCGQPVEPAAWPAHTAIDWSDLGPTIGERRRPLATATPERIRRGLMKFRHGPAVVIPAKSVWGTERPVSWPLTAQTSQQEKALATLPLLIKNYGSAHEAKYRAKHLATDALGAITEQDSNAIAVAGVVVPRNGTVSERPNQTRTRALADPLFTLHATPAFGFAHMPGGRDLARRLTTPGVFAKFNGGPADTAWHAACADPLGTITAGGRAGIDPTGLVVLPWVEQWRSEPAAVTEQLATVMSHLRHSLASIEADTVPLTDDELDGVRFRMLEPDPELRRGMAFPDDFILFGSKTDMTAGLGNAVVPPVASWITERCLATLSADADRMQAA